MTHTPTNEGDQIQDDGRAKWERPAFSRLNVEDAENMQKKAEDGVQGKGS